MRIARPLPDGGVQLERTLDGSPTGCREVIRLSHEDLREIMAALADMQWQMVLPLTQAPINGRVIPLREP